MHRVSHLVQAVFPGLPELSVLIERIAFEEKTNLVARVDEVIIVVVLIVRSGKNTANIGRIKLIDEFQRARCRNAAQASVDTKSRKTITPLASNVPSISGVSRPSGGAA